jgi:hypothetical protein
LEPCGSNLGLAARTNLIIFSIENRKDNVPAVDFY